MFANACIFRIAAGYTLPTADALEAELQKSGFAPCGPTQTDSSGWVPPRGKGEVLAEFVSGHLLLKLCTERRSVPAAAVKAAVADRVEQYKQQTGNERVPAKLKKEFKEEVLLELLPRAFPKRSHTQLWLSPTDRLLVVDSPTLAGADRIVTALLDALTNLGAAPGLQLARTETSPAASMAHWLSTHEAPWNFTVDRDCELKTPDEQKSAVRYSRHTLETDEVAQHIAAGKVPVSLAMTWNDRLSFVLTEGGQLRKIKLLDVVMEGAEKAADGFDADAAILAGELSALVPDLLLALGGEVAASKETT